LLPTDGCQLSTFDIGYIDGEIGRRWINESREISAMLVGLRRTLKS
jgi:hypothetical protein